MHTIKKLWEAKNKDRVLKEEKKQLVTYKRSSIRLTENFSSETRDHKGDAIFKVLKENYQPKILYLTKLSFKNEGESMMFPDKP